MFSISVKHVENVLLPQNVSGLRTKIYDFHDAILLSAVNYDIIIFVEAWLNSIIDDTEFHLENYSVHHRDQDERFSSQKRVLIVVRVTIKNLICFIRYSQLARI